MTRLAILIILSGVLLAGGVAVAQTGSTYDLSWSTVDNGGGAESSGGGYTLAGTAGQHDAGGVHSGGSYTLVGGFWAVAAVSVPPAAPVPGLTGWGLWALAGLLLVAILVKDVYGRKYVFPWGARSGTAR